MNGTSRPAFAVADLTGWIEHDGKNWPQCSPQDVVHCERRNGWFREDTAAHMLWIHQGNQFDIIRYRKVAP